MTDSCPVDSAAEIQTWLEAATHDGVCIANNLLGRSHPIAAAYQLCQLPTSVARRVITEIERATPDGDQAVVGLALSCVVPPYSLSRVTAPNCRLRSGYAFSTYCDCNSLVAKFRAAADEAVRAAVVRFDEDAHLTAHTLEEVGTHRAIPAPSPDDDKFRSVLCCMAYSPQRMIRLACHQVASDAINPEIALLFIMYAYRTREAGAIGAFPEECQPATVAAVLAAAFERQRQPPVLVLPQVLV